MPSLFETVTAFLEEDGWSYSRIPDQTALLTEFQGENGRWGCLARVEDSYGQLVFHSLCPVAAPDERRLEMAEFLTRANYGMPLGNFELDLEDGEIRFKTSIDLEDVEPVPLLIKHVIYANVIMMDRYLPGIVSVAENSRSPVEAIAEIEEG
ncbi:MAG TPA: YbjN domain-containing protein [Chloroflexota bacterium]|nr:YbjN domain-containing protein [Chloroflexota bacterium]